MRQIIPMLCACLIVFGCSKTLGGNPQEETERNVSLSFSSADGVIMTKGGTADDDERENRIERLDVLFFRASDSLFVKSVSSSSVICTGNSGYTRMSLPVQDGSDNTYYALAVANSSRSSGSYESYLSGHTMTWAAEHLMEDSGAHALGENLLMYGVLNPEGPIQILSTSDRISFKMRRCVARIDVDATSVEQTFELLTAELRNVPSQAYIFPMGMSARAVVDSPRYNYTRSSSDDRDFQSGSTSTRINKITQRLYSYEYDSGDVASVDKTACLIIGGIYTSPIGVRTKCYYRVNLSRVYASEVLNSIERNKNYTVNIAKVMGKGYDTKEEAYQSGQVSMKIDISVWDNSGLSSVAFDGTRILASSHAELSFSGSYSGDAKTVTVRTENIQSGAWSVTQTSGTSWCEASSPEYTSNGGFFGVSVLSSLPSSEYERVAEFTISAGELSLPLTVRQTNKSEVSIICSPSIVSAGWSGLEEYQPSVEPDKRAKILFEFEGLVDKDATYSLHVSSSADGWCRVKDFTSGVVNPSGLPVHTSNYFVVEVDRMYFEDDYREGFIAITLYHDGTVSDFQVPVYQTTYQEQITLSRKYLYKSFGTSAGSEWSFTVKANCDWYTDWGSAKTTKWIANPDTMTQSLEGSANTSTAARITKLVGNCYVMQSSYIDFYSKVTGNRLARLLVFSGQLGDGYASERYMDICHNVGRIFSTNRNTKYGSGIMWGQSSTSNLRLNMDPKAWNAGTEDDPVKGYNDPCPEHYRMITKKEAEMINASGVTTSDSNSYNTLEGGYFWTSCIDTLSRTVYVHRLSIGASMSTLDVEKCGIIPIVYPEGAIDYSNFPVSDMIYDYTSNQKKSIIQVRCVREQLYPLD